MEAKQRARLLAYPDALSCHIADTLYAQTARAHKEVQKHGTGWTASAVLFLLQDGNSRSDGPSLVLNKRSEAIPQPGDLCCPGGGIAPRMDPCLARAVQLPRMPMARWSHRRLLSARDPNRRTASLLLATAMREGFEEMRLLPAGVTFLGLLPPQPLNLLRRAIHPVVARLDRPQRFRPNWEVEAVVWIPLSALLEPANYARYRVRFLGNSQANERVKDDLVCYRHQTTEGKEVLWGATFRIVARFLERVFAFVPPPVQSLPLEQATFDETYFTGRGR